MEHVQGYILHVSGNTPNLPGSKLTILQVNILNDAQWTYNASFKYKQTMNIAH